MSIQYMVLGFEPMTYGTSSQNQARATALNLII